MSAASKPLSTQFSESLPAKRKRGRPRKDDDLTRNGSLQSNATPTPEKSMKRVQIDEANLKDSNSVNNMTGQNVYGVIEGSFDAGYFLTVRIGNNGTPLRGVVFLPGKFVPITAANDVAPQAKMYQTRQADDQNPVNENPNQEVGLEKKSQSTPPIENLRMVEQDEVMQVFEVTTPLKDPKAADTEAVKDVSQSSSRVTATDLRGNKTMNQEPQFQQNAVEGTNQETRQNPLAADYQSFPSESQTLKSGFHPSPLHHNGPTFELHEIPVVARLQSDIQAMEFKLQPTDLFREELKSSNFKLHQDRLADQSSHPIGDLVHNELKNPNLLPQKDVVQETNLEPEAKVANTRERCRDGEVGNATSNNEASSPCVPRTREDNAPLKLDLGESVQGGRLYELASCSADCTTDMNFGVNHDCQ